MEMRAASAIAIVIGAGCGDDLRPNIPTPTPTLQVGYDAYRRIDALPQVHILDRAYMRSTYDRSGGNEGADASHFIRQESDGTLTSFDLMGMGVLVFTRANHWHGSPWHEVIDGVDHVVSESSTADPTMPVAMPTFLPEVALPSPLALTWPVTHGSDLDWVPKPFASSLRFSLGRTHYGTGNYIFHVYPQGADNLSTAIAPWDESPPPNDVIELLARAGTDISPPGVVNEITVDVPAVGGVDALALSGRATIRKLAIDAPTTDAVALADAHLVITWDDRSAPSIDAPIGLLFAGGSLYNRDGRAQLVAGLLANVVFDADRVRLALYYPMPFHETARISLRGVGQAIPNVHVVASTIEDSAPMGTEGYFHATFVDHEPVSGQDLVLLDTTTVEGGADWCGSFVGTSLTFSDRADFGTLEGDPRFFFDDARTPQGHGTGTEEWGGGGDYWGLQTTTLPLAGHPTGAPSLAEARTAADAVESEYRFLVADAMPFGRNARIQLQHGGTNASTEHYRTVVYWYGRPSACLVKSDEFQVGDLADERAHAYVSPLASAPLSITSHWDGLGGDTADPVETQVGRATTGTSSFTLKLDPANRGALLRRTLDYAIADQRAEVWIADDRDGAPFQYAGTWYVAGSTTCIYSNPPGELDAPVLQLETVDRRLRDDELLLPRALTEGRSSIRIEIRVAPSTTWSEIRYDAYAYVL
jgi:hypothetical protein